MDADFACQGGKGGSSEKRNGHDNIVQGSIPDWGGDEEEDCKCDDAGKAGQDRVLPPQKCIGTSLDVRSNMFDLAISGRLGLDPGVQPESHAEGEQCYCY
ncbi:hypothetical protein SDC9_191808 [bioreactor metagenome]|uniref:Uncharacterized protein n=1 Tax=bioreactor metagenome TaxID=1076179 RepID=A0A645I067_9ZZZZ